MAPKEETNMPASASAAAGAGASTAATAASSAVVPSHSGSSSATQLLLPHDADDSVMTKERMLRRHQDIVQRSFDTFMALDKDGDRYIDEAGLRELLRQYSSVISVSEDDARVIMELSAGPGATRMQFSDFHNVFSGIQICCQLQAADLAHLRKEDVRHSLVRAGISPTKEQVESMFLLGDAYKTYDRRGPVRFLDFFRVFHHTRTTTDAHDLFLHSWFHAGRNSTPYNKPVEISPVQDFIAGTMAGVSLTLVGHPFDTIKVRLQTHSAGVYRGGVDCLRQTVSKEGILALYKGMSGPMLTIPLVNAVVFAAYAQAKDLMHKWQPEPQPLNLWQISLAGAYAGLVNCLIVSPVELVKTRLQIQHDAATLLGSAHRHGPSGGCIGAPGPRSAVFDGPLDCVRKIVAQNGVKGLFRGMSATIYREIPGYAGQFFAYEGLKRIMTRPGEKVQDLGAVPLILAGGSAGIFGWMLSYPQDFIKSQIQAEPYHLRTPYRKHPFLFDGGFISCWKQTVASQGQRGLWKGFGTCIARAFPANAAGFLAYEFGLSFLQNIDQTTRCDG